MAALSRPGASLPDCLLREPDVTSSRLSSEVASRGYFHMLLHMIGQRPSSSWRHIGESATTTLRRHTGCFFQGCCCSRAVPPRTIPPSPRARAGESWHARGLTRCSVCTGWRLRQLHDLRQETRVRPRLSPTPRIAYSERFWPIDIYCMIIPSTYMYIHAIRCTVSNLFIHMGTSPPTRHLDARQVFCNDVAPKHLQQGKRQAKQLSGSTLGRDCSTPGSLPSESILA